MVVRSPFINPAFSILMDGAASILAVLAGHFIHIPGINVGRFGVELFFVLSGRFDGSHIVHPQGRPRRVLRQKVFKSVAGLAVFATITTAVVMAVSDPKLVLLNWIGAVTFTSNYISAADFVYRGSSTSGRFASRSTSTFCWGSWRRMSRRLSLSATRILSTLCVIMVAMMALGAILSAQGHDYFQVYWRSDVRGPRSWPAPPPICWSAAWTNAAFASRPGCPSPWASRA